MAGTEKIKLESREYQVELFELAVEKNIILYLPTGSGKTFIAILLIKHFANRDRKLLSKPINEGGMRSFFLVNTVALVEQQAQQIETQIPLVVGRYSGDMGVDLWEPEVWDGEINSKEILVMTSQILLDLVEKNRISLKNINLLIFDECHRAVGNHPMRQLMKRFEGLAVSQQPRVLGLTATLLNGNIKPTSVKSEIRLLEITYLAQIQTSLNEDLVKMYSTNAKESVVRFDANDTTGSFYQLCRKTIDVLKSLLEEIQIEDTIEPPPNIKPSNSYQIDASSKKTNKRLKNLADDVLVNMESLGVYGGSLSVLAHIVQIQQLLPNVQLDNARLVFESVIGDLVLLRKSLEDTMQKSGWSEVERIRFYSSHKVRRLFDILKKVKSTDSAIVFVQRRFSAKVLYYIVNAASKVDPKLSHIKCNFIVGYNVGDPFKDTRENYLQRKQNTKVMNMFNQGILNVMIASNVVEEGMDITKCNYVIQFDPILDFRAYVQSKGRARDKESNYIIMVPSNEEAKFTNKYASFVQMERALKDILYQGKCREREAPSQDELDQKLFATLSGLEPYKPSGSDGPVVTALSAIPLINRYFASLRPDKFTKVNHFWFLKEERGTYKCYLQLPPEVKQAILVEGTVQQNKENAKRSVALEACKILHKLGELENESLLPKSIEEIISSANFTPNYDKDEVFEETVEEKKVLLGTKKRKRFFEKKWADCLTSCRVEAGKQVFLHVLDMKPMYSPPTNNHRLEAVHQTLSLSNSFALLSSKKLPQLAPFPLYMSTGELEGKVENVYNVVLNERELKQISDFHSLILDSVLQTAKKFMMRDFSNKENSYLIAPVIKGESGKTTVDWSVISSTLSVHFPSPEKKPTLEERRQLDITEENYLGKVISPWYRTVPAQKYLVTDVCLDKNEETPFPTDNYESYTEYFKDKYRIEPVNKGQPLLEVRPFSSRLNATKPRALTKQLKRKNKEDNEEFDVWLLPEFCVVYPLPGSYWLKALLLPSMLHRISQLCLAEEVRCSVAQEAEVGTVKPPPVWEKLKEDVSLLKEKEKSAEQGQALKPLSPSSGLSCVETPNLWNPEAEPMDIERNMESATLFDVYSYELFIKQSLLKSVPTHTGEVGKDNKMAVMTGRMKIRPSVIVEPPPLPFKEWSRSTGPEQVEVLQAITAAVANDFMNGERLETLGDSFLKFAISVSLFESQPDLHEGHLTNIKGRIVGNKNLYFCGKKKNLGSVLEVHSFSPNEDWVPPGFCVPPMVQEVILGAKLNSNCLYNIEIPEEERALGILGEVTRNKFGVALENGEDALQSQNVNFVNQQALTNKNIADAVEAILGVYLKSNGVFGALAVMNWFGVTDPSISSRDMLTKRARTAAIGTGDVNIHLVQPHLLEGIIGYKFRDRSFMLQALTHPTYTRNNITKSYQRLEFLGDCLIDFLITVHIFHKCSTLCPGDLTDLRSALVNNITLACITVRHQLYKFLLQHSLVLNECMMRFVKHQEDRNHIIDNDILFLVEEREVKIAEAIVVPKALGDVFEALVGAVYLDSGKSLETTWRVVYNLMKEEIEKFSNDIPKNHVRVLYESPYSPVFSSHIESDGVVMVTVEVTYRDEKLYFSGFGDNKSQAKRAAAKHVLRYIRKSLSS